MSMLSAEGAARARRAHGLRRRVHDGDRRSGSAVRRDALRLESASEQAANWPAVLTPGHGAPTLS